MAVMDGCEKMKTTPKLFEVKCPKCGEIIEVFAKDAIAVEDAVCPKCGYVIKEGEHI